jgi:hypothetical protein
MFLVGERGIGVTCAVCFVPIYGEVLSAFIQSGFFIWLDVCIVTLY